MVILSEMDNVVVPQKRPRERESGTGNRNSGSVNGSVNGSTTGSADAEHDPDHEPTENGGNQSTNTAGSTTGAATNGAGEEKEHHRKRARLSCNICKARKTKVSGRLSRSSFPMSYRPCIVSRPTAVRLTGCTT